LRTAISSWDDLGPIYALAQKTSNRFKITQVQEPHRAVQRSGDRPLPRKPLVQELLESQPALRRDSVNRAHATACDTLSGNSRNQTYGGIA